MHFLLTDKTSGEAKSRVGMYDEEEGLLAFSSLVMWYATASGEAIQERIRRVMNPGTPKKDEEIIQVLEMGQRGCQSRRHRSHGIATRIQDHVSQNHHAKSCRKI